jgi:adenosine deaminase
MDVVSPYLALEKAELHCHMDGVLDPAMLQGLREQGIDLGLAPEALAALYPIASKAAWLQDYCALVAPCLQPKPERLLLLLEQHLYRLRAQHVRYAEIMLNGLLFADPDLGKVQEIFAHFHARAHRAGAGVVQVAFIINTDDPGSFGCSMISEYTLVAQTFGLTSSDFERIYDNTIRSRFGGTQPAPTMGD